jgi:sulfotransferase family protein
LSLGRGTEKGDEIRIDRASGSELLERARPLFVGGCARSGTTAFTDYLNLHEEILLCQERYKGRQRKVTWDLFTFERIMDFRPEETKRPPLGQSRELFIKRHAELLARKDPTKLKWLGDKGPFYVRYMDRLAANNPGARFIMLYRPVEEIAESWDARAKNPDDPWRSERGYEMSVEVWNLAMRGMRNFIESSPTPRVLVVSYHDFFYRNEAVVPQISRFLGLEFDESVTRSWREASLEFESERRPKESLSEEQQSFIQKHADRAAEAWVLDRIEKQWREPGLYVVESKETALAALDEAEARMWRLQLRLQNLEQDLARQRQEVEREHQRVARERQEGRRLNRQLEDMQSSRAWRLLNKLDRIRSKISVK